MTFYDVYIARADDPALTRELDPWLDRNTSNCPMALSPVLYDMHDFHRICGMLSKGEFPGKQTDWGCWVVIVNKKQALKFFNDGCVPEKMAKFLPSLKDDQMYALVAREF